MEVDVEHLSPSMLLVPDSVAIRPATTTTVTTTAIPADNTMELRTMDLPTTFLPSSKEDVLQRQRLLLDIEIAACKLSQGILLILVAGELLTGLSMRDRLSSILFSL